MLDYRTIDEISYYNGIELPWQSALPHLDEIGGPTLKPPFTFTGRIEKVTVNLQ